MHIIMKINFKSTLRKLLIIVFIFGFTNPAFAYIDPGSGSLLLQMIVAGFIGLLFKFRAYFKLILKLIKNWLNH